MEILNLIGWRTTDLESAGPQGAQRTQLPTLKVGDQLQGRVARLLHQKLALVELLGGRLKALAELRTPLSAGQYLNLKVTATAPQLTLQTIAAEPAAGRAPSFEARPTSLTQLLSSSQTERLIGELKGLAAGLEAVSQADMPKTMPIITALERLSGHLLPLDPRSEPATMAAQLLARVRDGGLFLEQKLASAAKAAVAKAAAAEAAAAQEEVLTAKTDPEPPATAGKPTSHGDLLKFDLKPHLQRLLIQLPALMEALDQHQQLSDEGNRLLWSTITTLLEEIDEGRTRLTEQKPDEAPVVVRHSMWVAGSDKPLHFNVHLPPKGGRKGSSKANPMISLLLELARFNTLRVDIREGQKSENRRLAVDFWTQTEAVREDLQAVSAPLVEILKALYPQVDLKIALAPDRVAAFEKKEDPSPSGPGNLSRLDIRV